MHCVKKLTDDLFWIGASDRRLALFENVFPVPRGVSYNAYVVMDEQTILFDTVDKSVSGQFFENLAHVLGGRKLDYLVVNHMEPDHCATMDELVLRYPEVKIVINHKAKVMIKQFFTFDVDSRAVDIKEGDTLCTGKHTFTFVMAPMVHWPEAMVTYDLTDKVLFSADAFGTFGALGGNVFADEVNFECEWLDDARRYYTNIVGKYGTQVTALLSKAEGLDLAMVCPLHGPVWRKNIDWFVEKYRLWSSYTPEENAVMIAYASVYGNTENTANILAMRLADRGVRHIVLYDVSVTHPSVIVAEAFRCSHLVFASTTYNAGIFCNMETALHDIVAHNLQNRTVAIIENGSWAATAGSLMREILSPLKDMRILDNSISIRSSLKESQLPQLDALADELAASVMPKVALSGEKEGKIEKSALFKLGYGLFVLSAQSGDKHNGCIINTAMQITDNPKRLMVGINKANLTHDMVIKSGEFNLSVLSESAPFKVFEHFGFHSGRDTDKFGSFEEKSRSENGLYHLTDYANSFISCKVVDKVDCGTHTAFFADVTEAKMLSAEKSITYDYYFEHTKPKPKKPDQGKKGFICKICGYVYEGDTLPADYICPLCKHGAEDFEPLK